MRNAETIAYMIVGLAIISGFRFWYRSLTAWLVSFRYPPQPPVPTWTYCIAGDHMARSDHMAWYGDAFICDDCVNPPPEGTES